MSNNDNPKLTITLTDRRPVTIVKEDWQVIAAAETKEYDSEHDFQANRKATWRLFVRMHKDGRAIVHGSYTYTSNFQKESGADIRGGELLTVDGADADHIGDTAQIIAAIRRVGESLEARMPEGPKWSKGYFPQLIHECIADIPRRGHLT